MKIYEKLLVTNGRGNDDLSLEDASVEDIVGGTIEDWLLTESRRTEPLVGYRVNGSENWEGELFTERANRTIDNLEKKFGILLDVTMKNREGARDREKRLDKKISFLERKLMDSYEELNSMEEQIVSLCDGLTQNPLYQFQSVTENTWLKVCNQLPRVVTRIRKGRSGKLRSRSQIIHQLVRPL